MPYNVVVRKEPFTVGSYIHVIKRGARGLPIVQDNNDQWRFLLMLNHFNDHFVSESWFRDLKDENLESTLHRASGWPEKNPIVAIEAFTLMSNHFHLMLKETEEGGVTKFMPVCTGVASYAMQSINRQGVYFRGRITPRHFLKTPTLDTPPHMLWSKIPLNSFLKVLKKHGLHLRMRGNGRHPIRFQVSDITLG